MSAPCSNCQEPLKKAKDILFGTAEERRQTCLGGCFCTLISSASRRRPKAVFIHIFSDTTGSIPLIAGKNAPEIVELCKFPGTAEFTKSD